MAGQSGDRAFLFADGAMTEVGMAPWVTGMNASRHIVGSINGPKPWPAVWLPAVFDASSPTPSTFEVPLPPGAIGAHGEAINDAGVVVGTSWTEKTYDTNQSAFIYADGVSTDLNTLIPPGSGWHLEFAEGINNAGQIVCEGQYLGNRTSVLLTPVASTSSPFRFDALLVAILFGGVTVDGGGFAIVGGKPIPIGPWGPYNAAVSELTPERRDVLIALATEALAGRMTSAAARETLRRAAVEAAHTGLDRLLSKPSVQPVPSVAAHSAGAPQRRMKHGKRVIGSHVAGTRMRA